MTAEDFEKWVFDHTEHSVWDVADIDRKDNSLVIDVESIKGIAEAYYKAEAEKLLSKLKHPTNTKLFNRRIEREIELLKQ